MVRSKLSPQELQSLLGESPSWATDLGQLAAQAWQALFGRDVQSFVIPDSAACPNGAAGVCCRMELLMDGCTAPLYWEVDRQLAAALVDVQVGGSEVSPLRARRELTEIEQLLLDRAFDAFRLSCNGRPDSKELGHIKHVNHLEEFAAVNSAAAANESNAASTESTRITHEFHLLGASGRLTWLLTPEHVRCLSGPTEPQPPRTLTAVLAEFELPTGDLADLAVGDIITTDTLADAPIVLYDDAGASYPATLGRLGDLKAVRLERGQ